MRYISERKRRFLATGVALWMTFGIVAPPTFAFAEEAPAPAGFSEDMKAEKVGSVESSQEEGQDKSPEYVPTLSTTDDEGVGAGGTILSTDIAVINGLSEEKKKEYQSHLYGATAACESFFAKHGMSDSESKDFCTGMDAKNLLVEYDACMTTGHVNTPVCEAKVFGPVVGESQGKGKGILDKAMDFVKEHPFLSGFGLVGIVSAIAVPSFGSIFGSIATKASTSKFSETNNNVEFSDWGGSYSELPDGGEIATTTETDGNGNSESMSRSRYEGDDGPSYGETISSNGESSGIYNHPDGSTTWTKQYLASETARYKTAVAVLDSYPKKVQDAVKYLGATPFLDFRTSDGTFYVFLDRRATVPKFVMRRA